MNKGFTVIEVIVGVAVLFGVFLTLGGIAQYTLRLAADSNLRIRSAFLASEGIEAVKLMRDQNWTEYIAPLTPGMPYYLVLSSNQWRATTTASAIDGIFTRTLMIENVSRDGSDRIVASGGTPDPNTKKVTATVSWSNRGIERSDMIATYVTNLFSN